MTVAGSRRPSPWPDKVEKVRGAMDFVAEMCRETGVDLDVVSDVYVEGPNERGEIWPVINASVLSEDDVSRLMDYAEGKGFAATVRRNEWGETLIDVYWPR